MVPLYAARLEDLGLGNLVRLECACGRTAVFTPAMLRTAGVEPAEKVVDLESRFRCRECDARGKAAVSIKWERQVERADSRPRDSSRSREPRVAQGHGLVWFAL